MRSSVSDIGTEESLLGTDKVYYLTLYNSSDNYITGYIAAEDIPAGMDGSVRFLKTSRQKVHRMYDCGMAENSGSQKSGVPGDYKETREKRRICIMTRTAKRRRKILRRRFAVLLLIAGAIADNI